MDTEAQTGGPKKERTKLEEVEEFDDDDDEETKEKKANERSMWTNIWQGAAAGTIVLQLVAIGVYFSTVQLVALVVAVPVAGAVAFFQMQLQNTDCK